MTIITIELKEEGALRTLEEMEQRGEITIQSTAATAPAPKPLPKFEAMSYSTKDFKFDRDEANER